MPRYKLTIEYDGEPFCGWQIQDNGPSVQGALEDAVKAICGEKVRVHGAGRTDAGVHALGQVAHCDIAKHFVPGRFRDGLNAHLRPHPIGVLSAEVMPTTGGSVIVHVPVVWLPGSALVASSRTAKKVSAPSVNLSAFTGMEIVPVSCPAGIVILAVVTGT